MQSRLAVPRVWSAERPNFIKDSRVDDDLSRSGQPFRQSPCRAVEHKRSGRLPKVCRQSNVKALASTEERQQVAIVERIPFGQCQTQSSGILSSLNFPDSMQQNFIILNSIGFLGIKRYTLENKDGKFWGTEAAEMLSSTDPNFRPTDFKSGDDGALGFPYLRRRGEVAIDDVRIHPDTLEHQARVAQDNGNPQLAENFRRAAELAGMADDEVMALYEALRPGRSSAEQLLEHAQRLAARGAQRNAELFRQAAATYARRGLTAP